MISVTKRFKFEACHHIPEYEGACSRLHGHSYKLEVTVGMDDHIPLPPNEMVVDFSKLKEIVNEVVISKVDHQNLNDFYVNPTAEVMAIEFFYALAPKFYTIDRRLVSVKLWETEDCFAEVRR